MYTQVRSLGVEAGRRFSLADDLSLIPQAWLTHSDVSMDGFRDTVGSRVSLGKTDRFIAGLGLVTQFYGTTEPRLSSAPAKDAARRNDRHLNFELAPFGWDGFLMTHGADTKLDDVRALPCLHSQSEERVRYPTRKPLALRERIIKASSKEGNVELDPFCGCATAQVAADRLGRQ